MYLLFLIIVLTFAPVRRGNNLYKKYHSYLVYIFCFLVHRHSNHMGLALAPHTNDKWHDGPFNTWWASAALDTQHIRISAYNSCANGIVGWQHHTIKVASSSTLANRATTHTSTGHLPFYMAHNLTLSIFLSWTLLTLCPQPNSSQHKSASSRDVKMILRRSMPIWDINNYITDLLPVPLLCPCSYIHPSHLSSRLEWSSACFLLTMMLGASSPTVRQWDTLSPTVRLVRHSL